MGRSSYQTKFQCLIGAEKIMEQMPAADAEKQFQEYARFSEWLMATGHFIGANRLKPAATATTARVRNGKVLVSDGPFAETKEQLGGYCLIEAKDVKEAIPVASKIPRAQLGCVELQAVAEFPQTLALGFEAPRKHNRRSVPKSPARSSHH
jgi:hypothetical protein